MNFVGKILVVVQVVLSICFMAFAGAVFTTQTNWRAESARQQEQVTRLQGDLRNEQERFAQYQDEQTKLQQEAETRADMAEARNRTLETQIQTVQDELARTRTERDNQTALAAIAGEEAAMRRDEALAQRAVNRDLHQRVDQLIGQIRALEDDVDSKDRVNKRVAERYNKLLTDFAVVNTYLRQQGLKVDPQEIKAGEEPPPVVKGRVLESRKENDRGTEFVEISIGSDDGLLQGHNLFVYRTADQNSGRNKYMGKIRIVYVSPDRAVGTVVERAKNGVIQRGDHVTTQL